MSDDFANEIETVHEVDVEVLTGGDEPTVERLSKGTEVQFDFGWEWLGELVDLCEHSLATVANVSTSNLVQQYGKTDKTIRDWRALFLNSGFNPELIGDTTQGTYTVIYTMVLQNFVERPAEVKASDWVQQLKLQLRSVPQFRIFYPQEVDTNQNTGSDFSALDQLSQVTAGLSLRSETLKAEADKILGQVGDVFSQIQKLEDQGHNASVDASYSTRFKQVMEEGLAALKAEADARLILARKRQELFGNKTDIKD